MTSPTSTDTRYPASASHLTGETILTFALDLTGRVVSRTV